jgi:hypothetical protein
VDAQKSQIGTLNGQRLVRLLALRLAKGRSRVLPESSPAFCVGTHMPALVSNGLNTVRPSVTRAFISRAEQQPGGGRNQPTASGMAHQSEYGWTHVFQRTAKAQRADGRSSRRHVCGRFVSGRARARSSARAGQPTSRPATQSGRQCRAPSDGYPGSSSRAGARAPRP